MTHLPKKRTLTICWYVSFSLLFPLLFATHRSPNSILIDRRPEQNVEVQETTLLDSDNNVRSVNDVTENYNGDQLTTNTASGKFLESLREQCKKYKSISFICNSLRLVVPVTPVQAALLSPASEESSQTTDANRLSLLENTKHQKRFTQPSGSTDAETYIVTPEQYEETTVLPKVNHQSSYHKHMEGSIVTDRDTEYDRNPRQPYEASAPTNIQPDKDDGNYKRPDIFRSMDYLNRDNSEDSVVVNTDRSKETPYSESIQANIEQQYKPRTPDVFRGMAYQNRMMAYSSEDTMFRNTNTAEQGAYTESTDTNTNINIDYDEVVGDERNMSFEIDDDDDSKKYAVEDMDNLDCNDKNNCSLGDKSAESISEIADKKGDGGKSDDMANRLIDDSVKIFKNSFTIKFPTFERVTNKIKEWFQSVFGTKSRDEARGKLKKLLSPVILGLVVKGVIVLASVIGLAMKIIAAKAVFFGLASVIFTAVAIFKKFSSPQGGTIYVHTNGGAGHKNGGSWDKENYGPINHPHRVSKDVSGYQVWENYSKRHRDDYSTPATPGDRYYQYYNSYYRPNSVLYTTTMSPYIA